MSPHFRGVYVNNLGEEGSDRVRDAYGINDNRLADIKSVYDPNNVSGSTRTLSPPVLQEHDGPSAAARRGDP